MAIHFKWHDNTHSIIRLDMVGDSTWEQYHTAISQVVDALNETTNRIDVIINDPGSGMPKGTPMPHIKATAKKLGAYPHMGVIVVNSNMANNKLVQTLVQIVYRIYRIDTRIIGDFVSSLQAAEESITSLRTKDSAASV